MAGGFVGEDDSGSHSVPQPPNAGSGSSSSGINTGVIPSTGYSGPAAVSTAAGAAGSGGGPINELSAARMDLLYNAIPARSVRRP